MEELLTLRNLRIDHVTMRSELRYLIRAKVAGTVKRNRSPDPNQPKPHGVMSGLGYYMALVTQSGFLVVRDPDWGLWFSSNPDRTRVSQNRCYHYPEQVEFVDPGMLFEEGCWLVHQMLRHTEIDGMKDIGYDNSHWGDAFNIGEDTF